MHYDLNSSMKKIKNKIVFRFCYWLLTFLGLPPTNFSFPFNLQLHFFFYPLFYKLLFKNNKLEM